MKTSETLVRLVARFSGEPSPRPGEEGESMACRHLESAGFTILDRNWRCRSGEVDFIAREGEAVVFVEVKQRHGASHGEAVEGVTFGKRRRVIRAARLWAAARGLSDAHVRFDVVAIDDDALGRPRLRHDRDAFSADAR
jgi:putative endonuclease